jgi:hypothetical protein
MTNQVPTIWCRPLAIGAVPRDVRALQNRELVQKLLARRSTCTLSMGRITVGVQRAGSTLVNEASRCAANSGRRMAAMIEYQLLRLYAF